MGSFRIDRMLLGWLALAVAQSVAGLIIHVEAPTVPYGLEWMLVTDLIIAAVVAFLAFRSDWSGWKLAIALVAIPFAITFVDMVEGAVFLTQLGIGWRSLLIQLCLTYAIVLPLWQFTFARRPAAARPSSSRVKRGVFDSFWRFVVSDISYLLLYFIAGMIIFPFVRDFYATQTLPSYGKLVSLQLLVRGPVFVLICVLMTRMFGMRRWPGALTVGLAFTLLSGVAPLMQPNPYFPDAVRCVHFGEVVSSNFVFGMVVALLWGKSRQAVAPQAIAQSA